MSRTWLDSITICRLVVIVSIRLWFRCFWELSVLWSALKIKSETLSFDLLAIEQVSFVPQQILNPPHRVHLLCFLRVNPALPGL
jgi:hypothetical protein